MTIEEIVKKEGRQPDCSGYVTKYDIECSDGLTIRQGAFDDDNGRKVPMVWMHDHKDMENVLGHIYLESRDDGVYGLGYFNDSPKGQLAKLYVDHGDISAFSIYANKLQKKARDVVHGMIREVSLVLAGANRGALIDSPISHSEKDEDEGEGVICMGDDYGGPIYGNDEALSVEEYLEHYGRKGMKWGKNLFKTEYEAHPREKGEEEEGGAISSSTADDNLKKSYSSLKDTYELYKRDKTASNKSLLDAAEKEFKRRLEAYSFAYKFSEKEELAFLTEIQNRLNKDGINIDILTENGIGRVGKTEKEFQENQAKEALPNTPGMNAKPVEKKDDEAPNVPVETKVTDEERAKWDKNDSGQVWDKDWAEKYKKDGLSKNGYTDAEISRQLYDIYTHHGVEESIGLMMGLIGSEYGAYNRSGEKIKLPASVEKEFNKALQTYYNSHNARDQKKMQKKILDQFEKTGIESDFVKDVERSETLGDKIEEGVKESLNTLKDLGDQALDAGKEVGEKAEELVDETVEKLKKLFKHSALTDDEAKGIIQHYISGEITMDDILQHAEGERTYLDVLKEMNDEQLSTVYYMLKKARKLLAEDAKAEHSDEGDEDEALEHSDEEDNEMKQNLFDTATENKENTLSHADMEKLEADVFRDAKGKGSLKDSFLAHAGDYGIDDIEYLFPDDRKVTNTPTWIKRPDGWVSKVMKGVSHSPFSRIKSMFADITEPDARARGYVKGNKKVEEVFGLLKRSTSPTTVYKKQKLDRDDIIDITDFDVVSWLKTEMRGMLDEELARAFLIGDGRSAASNDKINEQNIRPIYSDDDLFVIRKAIAVNSSTTTDAKCKEFIRQCIKARKDYRGSGNPTLYTTEDLLTDLLLMEDSLGHPLYDSQDKLATKLRVKEIVTVPVFENQTRTVGSATLELMGIIVNLDDYKVGADKGGSVSMFEDFDIDYNQEKYLIETRCSGALTVPYSAIVIESSSSVYLDVDPDDPTETRYGKTVSSLQENVVVNDDSISGTLKYVTGYTGFSGDTALQSGHYLALKLDVPNGATTTLQLLNNGGSGTPVDLGSDDYAVGYIRSKNAKIVVTTTLAGVSVSKTYSLRLLKLESAS